MSALKLLRVLLSAAIISVSPRVALSASITDHVIDQCIADLGSILDGRAAAALERVDGSGRRLVALRSYLRSSQNLASRWSWTEQQIRAFEGSAEQRDLHAEIERVRAAFIAANPGYEIWVNPQVRSLDVQIDHWNSNASVESAGAKLVDDLRDRLGTPELARQSAAGTCAGIEQFLRSYIPSPTPTLAAPGLSPHGQMRAIDFQVHQADKVIAGPSADSIATVWDAGGWAERLDDAVRKASRRFIGPLASPPEPWHYTFTPDLVGAQ